MSRILLTSSVIAMGLGVQMDTSELAEKIKASMLARGYIEVQVAIEDGGLKIVGRKSGQPEETVYLAAADPVQEMQLEEACKYGDHADSSKAHEPQERIVQRGETCAADPDDDDDDHNAAA
ncbi:hypothetical protein [Shimia marina]|uniref:Uncharacterized protein n=1 Tax=Shimia marina TaxID=321267 RepID=A0A0P1ERH0_9RHOB|nr:hypothetical protein [Shimia marina]CUH52952.1 hypothetical protein SHM7688_02399 [Shimia marina]SFD90975.1 hypothetical protein SAMN04488037_103200 [Shimia marina]